MFSVGGVDHSVIRTCVSQKVNVPLNPQFRNGKGDLEYRVALSDRIIGLAGMSYFGYYGILP